MSKNFTPEPTANGCTQSPAPVFCCVETTGIEKNKSIAYDHDAARKPASFFLRRLNSRKKRYAPGNESATNQSGRIEGTAITFHDSPFTIATSSSFHINTIRFMKTLLRKPGILAMLLMFASLFFVSAAFAQTVGEFRSRQTGNWNDPNTWEQWNGTAWVTQHPNGSTPNTPVEQNFATGVQSAADVTSHAITLPTGIVNGELLLVVFSSDGNPTVNVGTGTGWIKLGQTSNGNNDVTGAIFWKIANGSDALTLSTSNSQRSSHITYRFSNASSVTGTAASSDGSTNSNPPNHTPPGGSRPYIWVATRSGDNTVVATASPSGYGTLRTIGAGDGNGASTNTATLSSTAASQDPGTFTSATEQWVSYTLAVQGTDTPIFAPISFPQTIFPVVAGTAFSGETNNVSTHNVALPSGIGIGDLLLVFWADRDDNTNVDIPTGWTVIYNTVTSDFRRLAMYKIASGTEGTNLIVTTSTNDVSERSAHNSYRIAAGTYHGVPTAGTVATGTSANPNPPSFSPAAGNKSYLWIASSHSEGDDNSPLPTAPASYTNLVTFNTGDGTNHARMTTARRELATATEDPGTFTLESSVQWGANTVAIQGSGTATILNGHTVTTTANVSVPNVTINTGGVVNINNSITHTVPTGGTFVVNGTLQTGTNGSALVAGGGNFTLNSGGTLGITSTAGITTTGATGNIQVTGTRTYATGADYIYNGNANQVTGNGLTQNTPRHLTIANTGAGGSNTVSLSANTTLSGNLAISQGILDVTASNFALNIGGNWNNNVSTAAFVPQLGTVTFNGTTQLINGSAITNFYNLSLANSGTKTFGFATTVSNNISINTGVVANLGTFTHSANTLTLGGSGTSAGSWGSSASAATFQNDVFFALTTGIINVAASSCNTSITLGTIPGICIGATSFTIPYTGTTGSPNQYSISGTGIVTVTNAPLPASPITVTLTSPASVAGPISFTLSVANSTLGCFSPDVNSSVTVSDAPIGTNGTQTICSGLPSNFNLNAQITNSVPSSFFVGGNCQC